MATTNTDQTESLRQYIQSLNEREESFKTRFEQIRQRREQVAAAGERWQPTREEQDVIAGYNDLSKLRDRRKRAERNLRSLQAYQEGTTNSPTALANAEVRSERAILPSKTPPPEPTMFRVTVEGKTYVGTRPFVEQKVQNYRNQYAGDYLRQRQADAARLDAQGFRTAGQVFDATPKYEVYGENAYLIKPSQERYAGASAKRAQESTSARINETFSTIGRIDAEAGFREGAPQTMPSVKPGQFYQNTRTAAFTAALDETGRLGSGDPFFSRTVVPTGQLLMRAGAAIKPYEERVRGWTGRVQDQLFAPTTLSDIDRPFGAQPRRPEFTNLLVPPVSTPVRVAGATLSYAGKRPVGVAADAALTAGSFLAGATAGSPVVMFSPLVTVAPRWIGGIRGELNPATSELRRDPRIDAAIQDVPAYPQTNWFTKSYNIPGTQFSLSPADIAFAGTAQVDAYYERGLQRRYASYGYSAQDSARLAKLSAYEGRTRRYQALPRYAYSELIGNQVGGYVLGKIGALGPVTSRAGTIGKWIVGEVAGGIAEATTTQIAYDVSFRNPLSARRTAQAAGVGAAIGVPVGAGLGAAYGTRAFRPVVTAYNSLDQPNEFIGDALSEIGESVPVPVFSFSTQPSPSPSPSTFTDYAYGERRPGRPRKNPRVPAITPYVEPTMGERRNTPIVAFNPFTAPNSNQFPVPRPNPLPSPNINPFINPSPSPQPFPVAIPQPSPFPTPQPFANPAIEPVPSPFPSPQPNPFPEPAPVPTTAGIPLVPPFFGGGGRGREWGGSRGFDYAPSLTAALFNIRGSARGGRSTSGLDLRPLIAASRPRRRSAKKRRG